MYQHLTAATATERRWDLRTEAERSRLAALAVCGKAPVWKRLHVR